MARPSQPGTLSFFWLLVRRDLKVRYAGATLGALWNLIHPIVMIAIYMVIFSSLIRNRPGSEGGGYALHLVPGMLVWLVFSEVLGRGTTTLVENAGFIEKVSFPPLVLHASVLFNVLIVYSAGLIFFWAALAAVGQPAPFTALSTLGVMALAGAGASGLAMLLSAMHVFFRDTGQLVSIALQVGFWLNPIVYPKSLLAESSMKQFAFLLNFNPMESFVSTAQALFGSPSAAPGSYAWIVIAAFPALALAIGIRAFGKLLPEIRDAL